jgi:hypothetical protein
VVLNLVLTLFYQDSEVRGIEALAKGKAKNNRIPIMLKDFANEMSFRITIKSLRHARGYVTTNQGQILVEIMGEVENNLGEVQRSS